MIEIELIVGTMGLDALFKDKLPKYSPALLKRAAGALKEFDKAAKQLSSRSTVDRLPKETYSFAEFSELQNLLQSDQEVDNMAQGLESWPSELQMPLIVQIADVKSYLQAQIPSQQMSSGLGATFLEPSDSDKFRFLWQANLVNDITNFGEVFLAGGITPLESAVMRTLFPMAHDYFIIAVMDELITAAVNKELDEWEGGWQKPSISALLGVPVTSFSDVLQNQTGMAEKGVGRPKGPGSVQLAQLDLTTSQKVDTKTLDLS
jgi:hypothetical protein